MEDRLQRLIKAGSQENRMKWPLEYKKQGKKVVGMLYPSIPGEIIDAAGMLPWQVWGTWQDSTPQASAYMINVSCGYITHVAESYLTGKLDFLDGILTCGWDDDSRSLYDVLVFVGRVPVNHILYMPHKRDERSVNLWRDELKGVKIVLEKIGRCEITYRKLWDSIKLFNTTRSLLTQVYQLRKREHPALSGAEVLGVVTASMVMPKGEFNKELSALMPYLETRKANLKTLKPRLLLVSDFLDDPRYIEVVEDVGAAVVMDALDTGSSYFWGQVGEGEPYQALAEYYINQPASPHLMHWDEQSQQIIDWAKEFEVDGVLQLPLRSSFPPGFRLPYLKKRLSEANIKEMDFEREYQFANEAQLRTRVGAFIEMLRGFE